MENSFLWNNPPLAALHQMAELSPSSYVMLQQHTGHKHDSHQHSREDNSSSASPPLTCSGTPHRIHDILTRKPPSSPSSGSIAMATCSQQSGKSSLAAINSRMFFNPSLMMAAAAGNKHLQDLRSLYCWPHTILPNMPKNHNISPGGDGLLSDDSRDRRGKKNTRPTFTGHQIFALEKAFEQTKYLAGPDRAKLAFALGMSESQVKVWFQNRRTKHRKRSAADVATHRMKMYENDEREGAGCESDSKSEND